MNLRTEREQAINDHAYWQGRADAKAEHPDRLPDRRECVQCGSKIRRGQLGKIWPTGAMSCRLCYDADFGL